MATLTWDLEISFTDPGDAESFTSVKPDTRAGSVVAGWGNTYTSPIDRVANHGTITFVLDNSESNSDGTVGYYSPDHASKRPKFQLGNPVRLKLVDGANTRYKKYYITNILPVPGVKLERSTKIVGVDYMGVISNQYAVGLTPTTNQRTNQGLTTIAGRLKNAPDATSFATGLDIYKFIFGDFTPGNNSMFNAAQRLVQSDMGYLFCKCDDTFGETLTYETRATRLGTVSAATIESASGLEPRQEDTKIYNDIIVAYTPVTIGETVEVVYTHSGEIVVGAGESYSFTASYTDIEKLASEVHHYSNDGFDINIDGRFTATSGGGGNELDGYLGYTIDWNDESADITLTNNAGFTGYVTFFQLRAYAVKVYAQEEVTAQDVAANLAYYGQRTMRYTLPYLDNTNVIRGIAAYLLMALKTPHTDVISVDFFANRSAAYMTAGCLRDIGDRVTITETVTGLNTAYNIIGLQKTILPGNIMSVRWMLEPANVTPFWWLGVAGYGELDDTTYLGY